MSDDEYIAYLELYIAYLERRLTDTKRRLEAAHRVMAMNVRDAAALVAAIARKQPPTIDLTERPVS